MPLSLAEVTTVTKSIIRVEIMDGEITRGSLVDTGSTQAGTRGQFITYNSQNAMLVGEDNSYVRYEDTPPDAFLNRTDALNTANWAVSGMTISAVYLKSTIAENYGKKDASSAFFAGGCRMRHYVYIELTSNIVSGTTYTITFPSSTSISNYDFAFDERTTRCSAIQGTLWGHHPNDPLKEAYMSQWIPGYGTDGVLDLSAFTQFYIIDNNNVPVFGPAPITLAQAFDDTEVGAPTRSLDATVLPSTTRGGTISSITNVTNPVVTYSGDDPVNGQVVWFTDTGNSNIDVSEQQASRAGRYFTVQNVDTGAGTFELDDVYTTGGSTPVNCPALGTASSGNYYLSVNGASQATFSVTNVYNLDYSAWVPAEQRDDYAVWVPGLGISDRFRVGAERWIEAARYFFNAIYTQRLGQALSANQIERVSDPYTTPATWASGLWDSSTIMKTNMPGFKWHFEYEGTGNGWNAAAAAASPWVTATPFTTIVTGHKDAGDWESLLGFHVQGYWVLMETWEQLPTAFQNVQFGAPKLEATLGSTFAGTDQLSDILAEVIYGIEMYRVSQHADGYVIGGIGQATSSPQTFEPSWCTAADPVVLYPEHVTTFCYAMIAAKLAICLNTAGYTDLAAIYETSAESAYNWANDVYNNTGGLRDSWFATAKSTAEGGGYGWTTDTTYNAVIASMQSAALANRAAAAAALYRLTGTAAYVTAFDAHTRTSSTNVDQMSTSDMAQTDYATAANLKSNVNAQYALYFDDWVDGDGSSRLPSFKVWRYNAWSQSFGQQHGILATTWAVGRGYEWFDNSAGFKGIVAGLQHNLGCNQTGKSYCSGMGARHVKMALHEDSFGSGQDLPKGIPLYGAAQLNTQRLVATFYGDPLSFYALDKSSTVTGNNKEYTKTTPWRYQYPLYEQMHHEGWKLIEYFEFTWWQSQAQHFAAAITLAAYHAKANTLNTYPVNNVKRFG